MLNQRKTNSVVSCTTLASTEWQNWSVCPYTDALAVFRFEWPSQLYLEDIKGELTTAEMERAKRFRRQDDQLRFMGGRLVVRRLLSQYLGQSPDQIRLTEAINRKPVLANESGWHFNISHSGDWILVTIGNTWVGVDLEKSVPGFDFQAIVSHSFSRPEQQSIEKSLSRVDAFYTLWTRKEALVKATAKGVDEDFAWIPSLNGTHTVDSQVIGGSGDWLVNSFWVAEGYQAAMAYPDTRHIPQFYTLDSQFFTLHGQAKGT